MSHWRRPIQESDGHFLTAWEAGGQTGDVVSSGWAIWNQVAYATSTGEALSSVLERYRRFDSFMRWTNDTSRYDM